MRLIDTEDGPLTVFLSRYDTPISLMRDSDGDILLRVYRDRFQREVDFETAPLEVFFDEDNIKAEVYLDVPELTKALAGLFEA